MTAIHETPPSGRKIHANEGSDPDPHSFWITTSTRLHFYPLDPEGSVYAIDDIANGLAMTCRFGGQCDRFYSVAEHSLIVSALLPRRLALWGLLHDASEAYLCDLPRPIKYLPALSGYRDLEKRVEAAIFRTFGLQGEKPSEIKTADRLALRLEARDLGLLDTDWDVYDWPDVPTLKVRALSPSDAKREFLTVFHALLEEPFG
jgi:uncharacterized protein